MPHSRELRLTTVVYPLQLFNMEFYVYTYCDPRVEFNKELCGFQFTNLPFYVGKGTGDRIGHHLIEAKEHIEAYERGDLTTNQVHRKTFKIRQILHSGQQPLLIKVAEGLGEEAAYALELELTKQLGLREEGGVLLNYKHGGQGARLNKMKREQISSTLKEGYASGRINPCNEGKEFSEDSKKKMSESAKTRPPISDETRDKLKKRVPWNKGKTGVQVAWNKGKTWEPEVIEKFSKSLKGRKVWNKGVPMSEESKKKLSESQKLRLSK